MLFRGRDGSFYKSGFAPLRDESNAIVYAVGVDGAASLYDQLAGFRRTLFAVGIGGALAIVALSILVARRLARADPPPGARRRAHRLAATSTHRSAARRNDEIGRVADTMEQMREQLRARDERMQMMLAGIAHEVRNPLGGLELYAGLLRDDLAGDAEKLPHVARIERELGRLKIIVSDFLEYARRPKPTSARATSADLLAEVRDIAVAAAQPRNVRVQMRLDEGAARVAGDEGQLRRALVNLAHNAVQACAEDGTGEVTLGCARADGEVLVTVRDTGAGIDPDILAKILDALLHDQAERHRARPRLRPRHRARPRRAACSRQRAGPRHHLHARTARGGA